ncbi:universal stress protein [uncultured Ruegeria sp.]|uniref:universal stress protein n=1 Tax=uncultured Ruegeria sp. TaxID=259304 RepID=UPI002609C13D|nr:universal stress protein [uncultured Ruegeria sp.]
MSFDADRDATSAIEVARALNQTSGKITLLHVVEHLPQYTSDLLPEVHQEHAKTAVTEKLSPLLNNLDNASIEIVEGHAGRGILDYADTQKIDCIVIASHQPGLQDYLLGSTAARVVRHAHCAVHVIR